MAKWLLLLVHFPGRDPLQRWHYAAVFSSTIPLLSVVQSLSHVWLFATPWTSACQPSLSFTISRSLLKLMSIELVMSSNHLILCCPLLLSSIFPSIRMMGNHLMSQLFASGALSIVLLKVTQSIELFNSASLLLVNIQGWFLLGLTDLISFLFKGLSRVFSSTTVQKHQFFSAQPALWSNSHIRTWLQEKP